MSHSGKAARAKGTGRTTSSGISHPAYRHGTKGVETVPVSPRTIDSSGSSSCFETKASPPVYDAIVTCVGISGAGPSFKGEDNRPVFPNRVCVGTLPPGAWYIWLPTEGHGMGVRTAPETAFIDANGTSWVRRGNGRLEEIPMEPASFYRLSLPLPWRGCEKLTE